MEENEKAKMAAMKEAAVKRAMAQGKAEQAKPSSDKTLDDVIREALERAAATESDAKDSECDCMGCSGNPIVVRSYSGHTMDISMREGTNRDGTPEMQVLFRMGKHHDADNQQGQELTLTEPGEVEDFKAAMQELFA